MTLVCRICGNIDGTLFYQIQEMMFGTCEKVQRIFLRAESKEFKRHAVRLNQQQRGDQPMFYLSLAGTSSQAH